VDKKQIQEILTDFIQEGKKENGYKILFEIEDWSNHYLDEGWAKGVVKILVSMFLRKHEKFIVDFIEQNDQIHELDDKDIIYQLLSKTATYHIMQSAKRTAQCNSKSEAILPKLRNYEKKESLNSIKIKAKKKAKDLLRYIPTIPNTNASNIGYELLNFINNIDSYYTEWEIPTVKNQNLKEYLEDLGVLQEEKDKYLKYFKALK